MSNLWFNPKTKFCKHSCMIKSMQSKICLQPIMNIRNCGHLRQKPLMQIQNLHPMDPIDASRARLHENQNQILIKITHLSQRCMQILISSQFLQEIINLSQKWLRILWWFNFEWHLNQKWMQILSLSQFGMTSESKMNANPIILISFL